jgi:methionyl-tRNA formyltransferase
MKYVFFGTPRFAEIILGRLIEADRAPVALVCNPDRPVGRKKILTPPPTKVRALQSDAATIDIIQPEKLDDAFIRRLATLSPDLFVVAAYAHILPREVLAIPRLGTLGVHPSLLPAYRGASPIQSVLSHGERETGTSIYLMDQKMDHGPIFAQEPCDAEPGVLRYEELEERLAELSARLLIAIMPAVEKGTAKSKPQDESKATFTKKFTAEDGFVPLSDLNAAEQGNTHKAHEILWKINGLNPEPGVWTIKNGKRIKLLAASIVNDALKLVKIQEEGGTPRSA